MVKGLDAFKRHFADYSDCYILIGGSACDVNFSAVALPFRVTHDLDMVLCVEALTPRFADCLECDRRSSPLRRRLRRRVEAFAGCISAVSWQRGGMTPTAGCSTAHGRENCNAIHS